MDINESVLSGNDDLQEISGDMKHSTFGRDDDIYQVDPLLKHGHNIYSFLVIANE